MTASSREPRRLVVVVGSVLALVLAAALFPVATTSFDGPPGLSLAEDAELGPTQELPGEFGSGRLGALDPGGSTQVGGLEDAASQSLQSLGPSVHFTVESNSPGYWRTGAFGEYTGSGWERTDGERPYDGRLAVDGMAGESVSYRVELNRSASAVPTVWRPRTVSAERSLVVTDRRAIRGIDRLPVGTVVEGTSVRPPSDPTVLRTAGRDYPEAIRERYTQLPDATPSRLARFTEGLTGGDDTAYETARTVENWLESNKRYSLNVSRPGDEDVASAFVFEMEKGYCEYYATAMVAMLRTQGVPARYVVGYSTGQPTGENTYTVRGMNAHAWVEVYFPDVGWVRFDPTPGGPRLSVEQAALGEQRGDSPAYNHTEVGSPGEQFSPDQGSFDVSAAMPDRNGSVANGTSTDGNVTESPSPDDSDLPEVPNGTVPDSPDFPIDDPGVGDGTLPGTDPDGGNETPDDQPVEISLSATPAPGSRVTVTVTRGGQPVRTATVLFDGEPIGKTDSEGTVTGTVPYTDRLNVTVVGGTTADADTASASVPPPDADSVPAGVPSPDDRQYAVPPPSGARLAAVGDALRQTENGSNRSRTYDVETNATLAVSGTVATGRSVVVTATVAGEPVRNATVGIDGRAVGTTDGDGRLTLTLPADPGNVTLSAARGPVAGTRELTLAELTLDVEPSLPLALPWTDVTVTASLGNETAAGVPVSVGGETVGSTSIDGTVEATLPASGSASITATRYGQTATVSVGGLWLNLVLVLGPVLALVGGVVAVIRRTDVTAVDATGLLGAVPARAVGSLLVAADAVLAAGRGVYGLLTGALTLAEARAAVTDRLSDVRAAATERFGRADAPETAADPAGTERAIRTAWGVFLSELSVRDPTTKTPGELATHAVERDGLPAEPVHTLRDAFRAVEYGTDDPGQRLSAVERAVEAITEGEP